MADDLKQAGRCLGIETPLGPDKLSIDSFTMSESISGLFHLQADLVSEDRAIQANQLIGQNVTVRVTSAGNASTQYFNGIVQRFSQGNEDVRVRRYSLAVVPWLWFLTQTSDLRIFQRKSVPDIIQQVFKDLGFNDFKLQLQGTFEPRDYCVQYRETDFNFVSRLMEEEGIFYFFEHKQGKHTLVLGNAPSVHQPAAKFETYNYVSEKGEDSQDGGVVSWQHSQEFRTGKVQIRDNNFQMPDKSLEVSAPSAISMAGNAKFENYDYPGGYSKWFSEPDKRMGKVQTEGERVVKLRMQEVETGADALSGGATLCGMSSGYKFDLKDRAGRRSGSYVLTSVQHSAEQSPPYYSEEPLASPYLSSFTCIPAAVPFRPQRTTRKPTVQGVQTATVVGVAGEEIDCDKYGRVKVQFHWDREGKKDQNSSCWIRVATMWGGKQWGMIHIPRIGQEVVVSFLEGDPDQPIIVGSVFNADYMPPYDLPGNKTQSGLVSRSTKQGTAENYNEISFEDKKGEELLYVRAEKDLTRAVENDETIWVGNDRWAEVDNKETIIVDKGDREVTLNQGNDKHTVKMGNRDAIIEMGNETLTIKMGNQTTKLNLGMAATEAMQSIEFKVGQSSIKIDQMGVTIKGMMISVEGQIQTEVKGLMTQVQGSAMLQAKGGITMIG
jgi:type VI secretion system secreted protein VgrG